MRKLFYSAVALVLLLSACVPGITPAPTVAPTGQLPTPIIQVQEAPDVQKAAESYLAAWKAENYEEMYSQLSNLTKDALSLEQFRDQHKKAAVAMTLQTMEYALLSYMVNPSSAQAAYEVKYSTTLLGEIERTNIMNLVLEDGAWHVQWEEGLILPELRGGNTLELRYEVPARGNIYDEEGYPLVAQDDAVAIGVVPGQIDPETENGMINLLSRVTDLSYDQIVNKYKYAQADWYVGIANVSAATAEKNYNALTSFPGIVLSYFRSRFYYDGGIAPHVVGYVLSISPEQLEEYQRKGYAGDEKIGATGLEQWGEEYLAGTHGATLYVMDPQGKIVTMLSSADPEPASSIYTTLDSTLQYYLQRSLGDMRGAIVVMERDTGRVLAMVSNPGFDPNLFEPTNANSMMLNDVLNDVELPLYNRAAQGVYPLGSVFKIITMAAALETGVFTPDYPYYCDSMWTELAGFTLYDWTYEKELPASGWLSLQEGLMRSCNPWFWHIGLTLWNDGYKSAIADLALGFGLGKPTGIEIPDFEGNVQHPQTVSDNVQLSIGQSTLQVSPLQVAGFIAAVGNGGTLYTPTVVDRIIPVDGGDPVYTFEPKIAGQLPISEDNLTAIQEALVSVVRSVRGTATYQMKGLSYNIAGKTGTAENPLGDSHAWFAGYTFNENPNRPDIAVAIILENAGEGSEMAAPLFRRVVSMYFSNNSNAGGTMPWEEEPYIPSTETPEP